MPTEFMYAYPEKPRKVMDTTAGADSDLIVRFYQSPVDELDHVEICFPGDKHTVVDEVAGEMHKARFEREWKAYSGEGDIPADGTRLENAPWMDGGTAQQLRAANIPTLEHLANLRDGPLKTCGIIGIDNLRRRARAFMADIKKIEAHDMITEQNAALLKRIEALEAQRAGA